MTAVDAADLIHALIARDATIATAESLTGGLVCAALTSVPGSSAVVRGGVVSYGVSVKADLLGVDRQLLDRQGAVDPAVAVQMAVGARRVLDSDYAVATTGSAGNARRIGKGSAWNGAMTSPSSGATRTRSIWTRGRKNIPK